MSAEYYIPSDHSDEGRAGKLLVQYGVNPLGPIFRKFNIKSEIRSIALDRIKERYNTGSVEEFLSSTRGRFVGRLKLPYIFDEARRVVLGLPEIAYSEWIRNDRDRRGPSRRNKRLDAIFKKYGI